MPCELVGAYTGGHSGGECAALAAAYWVTVSIIWDSRRSYTYTIQSILVHCWVVWNSQQEYIRAIPRLIAEIFCTDRMWPVQNQPLTDCPYRHIDLSWPPLSFCPDNLYSFFASLPCTVHFDSNFPLLINIHRASYRAAFWKRYKNISLYLKYISKVTRSPTKVNPT